MRKVLVLGATGFLGSHITRQLVAAGHDVHVMIRKTSNTHSLDDLNINKMFFSDDHLSEADLITAMTGMHWVFHSIVDARFYLRDSRTLFETNVEGLKRSMNAALQCQVKRFIFTSSFSTIACESARISDESHYWQWDDAPIYQVSRMEAEKAFFDYCVNRNLPGIACNVAQTYGEGDIQPTPHGNLLRLMTKNNCPILWNYSIESVGVKDAAQAMILAAEKGRVGQRYIISERYISMQEIIATVGGISEKPFKVRFLPMPFWHAMAKLGMLFAHLTKQDVPLHKDMFVLSDCLKQMSNQKAKSELGWNPQGLNDEIAEAINFYQDNNERY